MKILLITIGSHGDVHPFVGLGMALRQRGHEVALATNEHFGALVESAGLPFIMLGTDQEFRQTLQNPDLWHPTRALKAIFSQGVAPLVETTYRIIQERYIPSETVVVASSLGFGARMAQEKLGAPTVTIHLAPGVMRSVYQPPRLPTFNLPGWVPARLKRLFWTGADRYIIDPLIAPPINQVRQKLGLAPVSGILGNWWHSPQRVIGMWPDWFAPVQADWPGQVRLVGFPLYDESGITLISPELDRWFGAGPPPVAFTAGSANIHGAEFFRSSMEACARLKCRGLLLTRHREQVPVDMPPTMRHVDYAPFRELLPRCAALVHHGGIGTTAQALRAGVPQLVMPLAYDQFDNATRVRRLGAGGQIERSAYRAGKVAAALDGLIRSREIAASCRELADRFIEMNAIQAAAEMVEEMVICSGRTQAAV